MGVFNIFGCAEGKGVAFDRGIYGATVGIPVGTGVVMNEFGRRSRTRSSGRAGAVVKGE